MEIINLAELLRRIGNLSLEHDIALIRFCLLCRCLIPEIRTIPDLGSLMDAALRKDCDFFFDANGRHVAYVWRSSAIRYRCDPAFEVPMRAFCASLGVADAALLPAAPASWPHQADDRRYQRPRTLAMREADFASIIPAMECLRLVLKCRAYDAAPAAALLAKLCDQISTRQIKVFRSATGRIHGFASWGWLSPQTMAQISARPLHLVDYAEWREGTVLALCDCVYDHVIEATMRKELLRGLFPEQSAMAVYRFPEAGLPAVFLSVDRAAASPEFDQWLSVRGVHV